MATGEEERLPRKGQVATLVAVHNLQAEVVGATVVDTENGHVRLRLEDARRLDRPPLAVGRRVKLLYVGGPVVMRLAGTIEEVARDQARLTLRCIEAPRPGERREYIRAELVQTLAVRHSPPDSDLGSYAPAPDSPEWKVQLVDLSGSGMKLRFDAPCAPDDLLDIAIKLEARPSDPLRLRGRIVRLLPREDGEGTDVALQFEDLSLDDQDLLINLVFQVRYELLEG